MTSPRLLNTTRNDFELALLRSALTERAPEAARARALESVAQALAADSEPAQGSCADTSDLDGSVNSNRAARIRSSGMYLGMFALAAGVALLAGVSRMTWQRSSTSALLTAELAAERAHASATLEAAAAPGGAPAVSWGALPVMPSGNAQGALANTRAVTPQLRAEGALLQTLAEEDAPDWLGAQLQLLGEARRQLQLGALEHTQSLLDSYDQRFPGGVVGPQIFALRAELEEQRQRASAALPEAARQ
jgi:hypothetical protein